MAIKHNQQIQKNHFHKDWYATSNPSSVAMAC
jgi:hypothetical protein